MTICSLPMSYDHCTAKNAELKLIPHPDGELVFEELVVQIEEVGGGIQLGARPEPVLQEIRTGNKDVGQIPAELLRTGGGEKNKGRGF